MPMNHPEPRPASPLRPVRLPAGRAARGTIGSRPRGWGDGTRAASDASRAAGSTHESESAAAERQTLPRLGDILLERDVITADQLEAALERQKRTPRRLGLLLIDMGVTNQDAVLGALR